MIAVFFNGEGELFIKDPSGQNYVHNEFICCIEYDNYNRKWYEVFPNNKIYGDFMLTKEDELKYRKKELKYKDNIDEFDKNNLNFVDIIVPLPLDVIGLEPVRIKEPKLEAGWSFYYKIKKYKYDVINYKDKLHYLLYPILNPVRTLENIKKEDSIKPLNLFESNPNRSDKLTILNQASERFWRNSDKLEKTSWPDTKNVIIPWFLKHQFSLSLAKKAATIIRPEWAGSGRKPNE